MAWTRGIAAAAVVLALGGCAGIAGQASPQLGAQTAVSHPADRNSDAVSAGLRRIDACALLDGGQPVPLGPHACRFAPDPKTQIDVAVGLDSDFGRRWAMIPIALGGAKAYWANEKTNCQVDIPVSFTRAVHVTGSPCDRVKAAAATVAAKLGNPDAVAVPASRPLAGWDGCSLLEKAVGGFDVKAKVRQDLLDSPFDTCGVEPPTGSRTATVDLEYTTDPLSGLNRTPRQVGDKTAEIDDQGSTCFVSWSVGPSPANNAAVVSVRMKGCDDAMALAVKVQQVLAGPAPSGQPQRPLLYGANDPDTDAAGACVDYFADNGVCVPYQPFTLPASFNDWFPTTDHQPSISCAIAADAVRQVYGDTFKPVVVGDFCVFVEPTHALTLSFDATTAFPPANYGTRPDLYADQQTVTVSGKQAKTFTDIDSGAKPGQPRYRSYEVYVSPYNDLGRNGLIAGEAEASVPRGGDVSDPVDVSKLHNLDQVMTKIIANHVP